MGTSTTSTLATTLPCMVSRENVEAWYDEVSHIHHRRYLDWCQVLEDIRYPLDTPIPTKAIERMQRTLYRMLCIGVYESHFSYDYANGLYEHFLSCCRTGSAN